MEAHPSPARSQRTHSMPVRSGCSPLKEPRVALSVWPCCGVPEIVGGAVDAGATPALIATMPVRFETAEPEEGAHSVPVRLQSRFVAVTPTWSREPTSCEPGMYVWFVAPWIGPQSTPFALHRCH